MLDHLADVHLELVLKVVDEFVVGELGDEDKEGLVFEVLEEVRVAVKDEVADELLVLLPGFLNFVGSHHAHVDDIEDEKGFPR